MRGKGNFEAEEDRDVIVMLKCYFSLDFSVPPFQQAGVCGSGSSHCWEEL